jgi:hypothetical protein
VRDGSGHYVATVTFPESPGSYDWRVRMGWFGPHELGVLEVGDAATATAATTGGGSTWATLRWGMLAATVALGGVAIGDFVLGRRRRRHAAAVA